MLRHAALTLLCQIPGWGSLVFPPLSTSRVDGSLSLAVADLYLADRLFQIEIPPRQEPSQEDLHIRRAQQGQVLTLKLPLFDGLALGSFGS